MKNKLLIYKLLMDHSVVYYDTESKNETLVIHDVLIELTKQLNPIQKIKPNNIIKITSQVRVCTSKPNIVSNEISNNLKLLREKYTQQYKKKPWNEIT